MLTPEKPVTIKKEDGIPVTDSAIEDSGRATGVNLPVNGGGDTLLSSMEAG